MIDSTQRLRLLMRKHGMYGHQDPGGAVLTHPELGELRISAYNDADDCAKIEAFLLSNGVNPDGWEYPPQIGVKFGHATVPFTVANGCVFIGDEHHSLSIWCESRAVAIKGLEDAIAFLKEDWEAK